jgi:hypothetical protein
MDEALSGVEVGPESGRALLWGLRADLLETRSRGPGSVWSGAQCGRSGSPPRIWGLSNRGPASLPSWADFRAFGGRQAGPLRQLGRVLHPFQTQV